MTSMPSIACIGIIGKANNPLQITVFPPYGTPSPSQSHQQPDPPNILLSLLLNSSLDHFDIRLKQSTVVDQDLGLLHTIDERLATYGWLTNTGAKFIIVIDMEGGSSAAAAAEDAGDRNDRGSGEDRGKDKGNNTWSPMLGLRDADVKPAFRALQSAYVKLLQNPFYTPNDSLSPIESMATTTGIAPGFAEAKITNKKFLQDVRKIGEVWRPGLTKI